MKQIRIWIIVGVVVLLTLACATIGGGDNNADQNNNENNITHNDDQNNADHDGENNNNEHVANDDVGVDGPVWESDFGSLLESGDLILSGINSNSDGDTNGRILTVQFTNPTDDEIIVSLPCGLVFAPTETDEQELMMLQPEELQIGPGETTTVEPYVVCVELAAPPPAVGSGYTIGYLAGDQLLEFAECICDLQLDEAMDSMDGVGVQFAAWSVATGGDFTSLLEEEDLALGDEFEGLVGDELIQTLTGMFSSFGGEWLDRCGIILEQPAE